MEDALSINQNIDCATDLIKPTGQMEDVKVSEENEADQSLIEVKQNIPVIDLLERSSESNIDAEEKDVQEKIAVKTEPVWLKMYDVYEELLPNGDGDIVVKKNVKKELDNQDRENKTSASKKCKGAELKTEADTLILEIDNTDNLDVYLERNKKKIDHSNSNNIDKHDPLIKNLEKGESSNIAPSVNLPECIIAKEGETEAAATSEKSNDSNVHSSKSCGKKNIGQKIEEKEGTTKKSLLKITSLSDNAKKIIDELQKKRENDSTEILCKKIKSEVECNSETIISDQSVSKNEKKLNIENKSEKTVNLMNDSTKKDEDKKVESRFLWISNISKTTKAADLKLHLTSFGKVMTTRIVTDGKLYYGYVVLEKRDDIDNCIKNLDDTVFEGRKIRLSDRIPEKKTNKHQNTEQIMVKNKPVSPQELETTSEIKLNKEKIERKRKRSRSHDPLTLKVKAPSRRFGRMFEERRRRNYEEVRRRNLDRRALEQKEMLRRRLEMEREHEERRKQKIREEEHRKTELKLERERRKLERERELIEKERFDLIRQQKKLDTERYMLSRQKLEIERNIRNINEDYKDHKSSDDFNSKKTKIPGVKLEEPIRRMPENKEYWKTSPMKVKEEFYEIDSYSTKKREGNPCIPPPPPILSNKFDLSDRKRKTKEREWSDRGYNKKEHSEQSAFKDTKCFDRKTENIRDYKFSGHRENIQEKSYDRDCYKSKYDKSSTANWDKFSSVPYKNVPSSSWRSDAVRVVQRHPPSGFPVVLQFESGMPHYHPHPEYGRQNDFYGHPPERKY